MRDCIESGSRADDSMGDVESLGPVGEMERLSGAVCELDPGVIECQARAPNFTDSAAGLDGGVGRADAAIAL